MTATRLAIVILAVEDLARSAAFYRALTSWDAPVETPVYVELAAPNGLRLGLYDRQSFGKNLGRVPEPIAGPVATTELYLHADDLDESIARAVEAGARRLDDARDRPWGDRVAYFADPDGYVVALATSTQSRS